jgi:hypothetical protein
MVTDSAAYMYFDNNAMKDFTCNRQRGITHVPTLAYTQELNPTERHLGTIMNMARSVMLHACAPAAAYGEALMASVEVANRCPVTAGSKITRLERYHNRLMPGQWDHLRVWGCSVYVHAKHGHRGQLNFPETTGLGKLGPNAVRCMHVGYDANGLGWRAIHLPTKRLIVTMHATHVQDEFPCVALARNQLSNFLTPEEIRRYSAGPDEAAPRLTELPDNLTAGPRRSAREWTPSIQSLENIAAGPTAPPEALDPAAEEEKHLVQETAEICADIDAAFACAADGQKFLDDLCLGDTRDFADIVMNAISANESSKEDLSKGITAAMQGKNGEQWRQALLDEVRSHARFKTFGPKLGKLPEGETAIPFDVLVKEKRCGRKKARGILKGYFMQAGIHFNETFAPVPFVATIRICIAVATKFDWEMDQGDVPTAFLGADMDAKIFARVPNYFSEDTTATGYCYRQVLKAVPGVPQGPRLFHLKMRAVAEKCGLKLCRDDHSLYVCHVRKIILFVWVDDVFMFYPKESAVHKTALWRDLQANFDGLEEPHPINDCLGCLVKRDRSNHKTTLSQRPAFVKLLEMTGMSGAAPVDTPMVAGLQLSKKDCPPPEGRPAKLVHLQKHYRSVVASLLHFVCWSRPDMAQAVTKLCRYMHNPGETHQQALKRLLRYLAGTLDKGLVYQFLPGGAPRGAKTGVYGFYDAAHADCVDTLRSTMGYIFYLEGCPISWSSKLNTLVTVATNHSEYCAGSKAGREAKWLRKIFEFLGFDHMVQPIDLYSDSQGAIAMAYNPTNRAASKHIDLADHHVRELQERGIITITWVSTANMIADLFTKALARADFERHARHLVGAVLPA